jgi:hypothetical protein
MQPPQRRIVEAVVDHCHRAGPMQSELLHRIERDLVLRP